MIIFQDGDDLVFLGFIFRSIFVRFQEKKCEQKVLIGDAGFKTWLAYLVGFPSTVLFLEIFLKGCPWLTMSTNDIGGKIPRKGGNPHPLVVLF